jgi:hypothetical protein
LSNGSSGPAEGSVIVNKDCSVEMFLEFTGTAVTSEFQMQISRNMKAFIGRWENVFGVVGTTSGMKNNARCVA